MSRSALAVAEHRREVRIATTVVVANLMYLYGMNGEHAPGKAKIAGGTVSTIQVNRGTGQDDPSMQPEYVMLTMDNDDAICLTHVIASGNSAQWTWFGDLGYKCGADWYASNYKVGDGTYTPRCVWLDRNDSNTLRYAALALHMPDFAGDEQGKVKEYQSDPDTLCKSTRRMKFYPSMPDDGTPPFFLPPLNYTTDGADVDFNHVKDQPKSRVRRFEDEENSVLQKRGTSNPQPGHLVISGLDAHSANELCESGSSYGPDFVSTVENTYCDMSAKKSWPLCDQNGITERCFDLQKQTMRVPAGGKMRRGQAVAGAKKYATSEKW